MSHGSVLAAPPND